MVNKRIERIKEDIKRELAVIFTKLKDPRITKNFISVLRVEISNDLSYCKIYISAIEGLEKAKEAVIGLDSAKGFIKRELGTRLEIRHIPSLIFTPTDSLEYSANISKIISTLNGDLQ